MIHVAKQRQRLLSTHRRQLVIAQAIGRSAQKLENHRLLRSRADIAPELERLPELRFRLPPLLPSIRDTSEPVDRKRDEFHVAEPLGEAQAPPGHGLGLLRLPL